MTEPSGGTRKQQPNEGKKDSAIQDSDATSKETLSEIQEREKQSGSDSGESNPGPSPNGALDEPGEIKDAGPM